MPTAAASPESQPVSAGAIASVPLGSGARDRREGGDGSENHCGADETCLHAELPLCQTPLTTTFSGHVRNQLSTRAYSQQAPAPDGRYESVFLLAAVALGVATVPLAGGRLSRLAHVRLRLTPLIFGALAIQIVIVSVAPGGSPLLHRSLHVGSYALAGAFLVANRRIAGFRILALGALLNLVAIVANNGVMPASRRALHAAGELASAHGFANSTLLAHPRLLFLGDVFAIPKSWPLHNVFSIGDVCIAIGAAIAIHALSGSRLVPRRSHDELARTR